MGATGVAQAYEIVTQLRGKAKERQVKKARIGVGVSGGAFAVGIGLSFGGLAGLSASESGGGATSACAASAPSACAANPPSKQD